MSKAVVLGLVIVVGVSAYRDPGTIIPALLALIVFMPSRVLFPRSKSCRTR